jgi:hypothetical protein
MLYKYPQAEFPYGQLVAENARRSRTDLEYELLDTGVFDEDRYWDVFLEVAKGDPEDLSFRITATNHGPEPATLHVLPHLWFRNTWARASTEPRPLLEVRPHPRSPVICARHAELGARFLYCEGAGELLFTDNETNRYRLFGQPNPTAFQKDGINDYIVNGRRDAVNPNRHGTKSAAHYLRTVGPGESWQIRLRLSPQPPTELADPFAAFDQTFAERISETDAFYAELISPKLSPDAANVVRQGYAGLLSPNRRTSTTSTGGSPARGSRAAARMPFGTSTGSTCTAPTSSPCPTSGSTPGSPPGISRSTPSRWSASIPIWRASSSTS